MPDRAILTDAEIRAAEQMLFDGGMTPSALMERAGAAIADVILAADPSGRSVLVACGPGNNGGDGYVVARLLREGGHHVRVAALGEPRTEAAQAARARWTGLVEPITGTAPPCDIFVDAVFGSGQTRPLGDDLARWLQSVDGRRLAIDLPSGIAGDTGAVLTETAADQIVIAIGALKPGHVLMPARALYRDVVLAGIGLPLPADPRLCVLRGYGVPLPTATDNKYTRGKVVVVGGAMAGAAHLAAIAAQRSGAGYVELVTDDAQPAPPYALVRHAWSKDVLADPRIGAVAIGPGLADGPQARGRLDAVLALDRPVVLDAGALTLLKDRVDDLRSAPAVRVLTPHAGEYERLFGPAGRDPVAAVRAAAERTGSIVVLKGAATIVAAPDGRAAVAPLASGWLASAGTGDVLTGIVATMLAQAERAGRTPFEAVSQAIWLHAQAADLAGIGMIADDLPAHLPQALALSLAQA